MANTQTHLVAVFKDIDTARKAQNELIEEGFSNEDVRITGGDQPRTQTAASGSYSTGQTHDSGGISGFFQRIFGNDGGTEERDHYAVAVGRGNAVLAVDAEEDDVELVNEILTRYNPVNLEENLGSTTPATTTTGDRTIPVVQEDLNVGKRAVQRGGVRVYSRVTEEPVQESVNLHEERARVERRPVNRPATAADFNMKDEIIEVIETGEEVVVGKTARVVEEVVVGKDATNRTETVHDTVRRTDVQVENLSPDVDQDFREDFKTRYSTQSGADYKSYAPAYEYGYRMANDPRYKGKNWSDVENSLQSDYSKSNPGAAWDKVSAAVRRGWDQITGKR